MLIAANKADLCKSLEITNEIHKNREIINCSAETELLLKKAAKADLIEYIPGNEKFVINKNVDVSAQQKAALNLVENVLSKLGITGSAKLKSLDVMGSPSTDKVDPFPKAK